MIVARGVTAVDGQQLTKLVTDVATKESATTIVCVHDGTGKAVAPRVAAKLKAGHVAGAIALPEGNRFKRNVFSGKAQAFVEVTSPVKVMSLMPNSIPIAKGEGTATVEEYSGDLGAARITVKEVRKAGEGIPLARSGDRGECWSWYERTRDTGGRSKNLPNCWVEPRPAVVPWPICTGVRTTSMWDRPAWPFARTATSPSASAVPSSTWPV